MSKIDINSLCCYFKIARLCCFFVNQVFIIHNNLNMIMRNHSGHSQKNARTYIGSSDAMKIQFFLYESHNANNQSFINHHTCSMTC